jgi:hypothetical protein
VPPPLTRSFIFLPATAGREVDTARGLVDAIVQFATISRIAARRRARSPKWPYAYLRHEMPEDQHRSTNIAPTPAPTGVELWNITQRTPIEDFALLQAQQNPGR